MNRFAATAGALFFAAAPLGDAMASEDTPRWTITGALGSSMIGDASARYTPAGGSTGRGRLSLGSGFMTGGSIGWAVNPAWRIEADVTYRTNPLRASSVPGLDGSQPDADYASVLLMANVVKTFDGWGAGPARFRPYVGAGLGIAQEVDTDLNIGGVQREFSGSRPAWQLLAGVNWQTRSPWFAGLGLRYVDAGALRLKSSEPGLGEIRADYRGLGLDLRLGYRF